jgi:hypothetical protein
MPRGIRKSKGKSDIEIALLRAMLEEEAISDLRRLVESLEVGTSAKRKYQRKNAGVTQEELKQINESAERVVAAARKERSDKGKKRKRRKHSGTIS